LCCQSCCKSNDFHFHHFLISSSCFDFQILWFVNISIPFLSLFRLIQKNQVTDYFHSHRS
jgi:hypothetical protein